MKILYLYKICIIEGGKSTHQTNLYDIKYRRLVDYIVIERPLQHLSGIDVIWGKRRNPKRHRAFSYVTNPEISGVEGGRD